MPRTLPWLAEKKSIPRSAAASPSSSIPKKRPVPPPLHADAPVRSRAYNQDSYEEPPSSPAEVPVALEIEYMQEGFDADDRYRMVEDELYATAQRFTRYLHADEYALHKRKVLARGRDSTSGPARTTDGRTAQSAEDKISKKARAKSKRTRDTLLNILDGEITDPDSNVEDEAAESLFARFAPSKEHASLDLSAVIGSKVKTRAAAGFNKSPMKVRQHEALTVAPDESSDDDLDALPGVLSNGRPAQLLQSTTFRQDAAVVDSTMQATKPDQYKQATMPKTDQREAAIPRLSMGSVTAASKSTPKTAARSEAASWLASRKAKLANKQNADNR